MTLAEKVKLWSTELQEIKRLNEAFLAKDILFDEELELFLLQRERCLVKMRLQPIITADNMRLQALKQRAASGGLSQEEAELAWAYQALRNLHSEVVRQEQAVNMKMRGMQREAKQEQGGESRVKKCRLSTYTQQLQQAINMDTGSRFDRRR